MIIIIIIIKEIYTRACAYTYTRARIHTRVRTRTHPALKSKTYAVITAIPEATSSFLTTAHVFCTNFFCLSVNPVAWSILLSSDDEIPRKRRNVPIAPRLLGIVVGQKRRKKEKKRERGKKKKKKKKKKSEIN